LSTNSYNFLEWRDVSPATNHSILVLIRIMMQIGEFLTEFLPFGRYGQLWDFFCVQLHKYWVLGWGALVEFYASVYVK